MKIDRKEQRYRRVRQQLQRVWDSLAQRIGWAGDFCKAYNDELHDRWEEPNDDSRETTQKTVVRLLGQVCLLKDTKGFR